MLEAPDWAFRRLRLAEPAGGGPSTIVATTGGISIGRFNDNNDALAFFHGSIDEVRIWNFARTAAQIDAIRSTEVQGNEPGLVAAWHLNGTWNDATSGGATLVPGPGATFGASVPF